MTLPNWQPQSDARYIFILFGLIFVVVFFAFLIYFVYGQRQFLALKEPEVELPEIEVTRENPTPDTLADISTSAPVQNQISTETFDATRYNPRTAETMTLHGKNLLEKYFDSIQLADYQTACSLLTNTLCNARRDIYSFSQFLSKTSKGYRVDSISLASEQKQNEAIYCVQYTYTLKADLNPEPITEYFQYRIKTRPDGADEISARVCEKVVKDWRERPCPIITAKRYCF